jgi:hypothetical protein
MEESLGEICNQAPLPDFHLLLTEDLDAFQPRACRVVGFLRSHAFASRLTAVDLEPGLPAGLCGTTSDIRRVFLAPRANGQRLEDVAVGDVPVSVYVSGRGDVDLSTCSPLGGDLRLVESGKVRSLHRSGAPVVQR